MKNYKSVCLLILSILVGSASFVFGAEPIETLKNGFYREMVNTGSSGSYVVYLVDTRAHLCLLQTLGTSTFIDIPCELLVNREEWKPIITWVTSK